jgi:uncharacterized protein YndB with AHSA1/START domain
MSEYGEQIETASVRFQRLLPGPIERVWEYLTDSKLRASWFAGGTLEPHVGGKVHFTFRHSELAPRGEKIPANHTDAEGHQLHGRVTRCEPPRVLAYTWDSSTDPSEVSFELAPRGDEVQLTLTHRRLASRAQIVGVSAGWHVHLDVLAERLRGATPQRFWPAIEQYEREYERRHPAE